MNQVDNGVIFVAKLFLAYISPIDKYKKISERVENKTRNLSEGAKSKLSKVYLFFFLLSSFFFIWLSYYELTSTLETLSVYRPSDCGAIGGSCADTWLSGFVKQNSFMISTILEVSFLVVGVVVGNIGWDQASKIKVSGLDDAYRFFNTTLAIVVSSIVISLVCNDLVDEIQNEYYYRFSTLEQLLPFICYLIALVFTHVYLVRSKKPYKAFEGKK